jgi:phosphoribosyl-ATP pyrophosphohydrolase
VGRILDNRSSLGSRIPNGAKVKIARKLVEECRETIYETIHQNGIILQNDTNGSRRHTLVGIK